MTLSFIPKFQRFAFLIALTGTCILAFFLGTTNNVEKLKAMALLMTGDIAYQSKNYSLAEKNWRSSISAKYDNKDCSQQYAMACHRLGFMLVELGRFNEACLASN